MKTRLIPFSIKKAKKGAKIVTREGKFPVRIVDYKIKDKYYPILALIEVDGKERPNTFTTNGKISKNEEDPFDLFIEVEEKEEEEVGNYNPYKETVKSISDMIERYSDADSDLQDFYDNVKVKCREAIEYDKKELHKIEKAKTRRMTNQELSWWLRECPEEHREYCHKGGNNAHFNYYYSFDEANEEIGKNTILIRKNGGEWQEPLIEI